MKVLKVVGNIPTDASWKEAEGSSISELIATISTGVAIATVKAGKLKVFAKDEAGKLKSLCKELFTPEHVEEAKHWLMRNFNGVSIMEVTEPNIVYATQPAFDNHDKEQAVKM
ncbi:MAG: hypothetical protein WCO66_02045 [Candidatus Absconditabacteria bacterium]